MFMLPPLATPRTRSEIFFSSDGFISGVEGARKVIQEIQSKPRARNLNLAHQRLGTDGSVELFHWLCSNEGRRCSLEEIDLRGNRLKEAGFAALSQYLSKAVSPKDLRLNECPLEAKTLQRFADAIQASSLDSLTLSGAPGGDKFVPVLLSAVLGSRLRRLRVPMSNITPATAPAIAAFIASPRCRLSSLSLNGNLIGAEGVTKILEALSQNYSVTTLDCYANLAMEDLPESFVSIEDRRKRLLARNRGLRGSVGREALVLLRHSRTMLLRGTKPTGSIEPPSTTATFSRLPVEIQHYILTFLTTTLSDAQCIRIIKYAVSPATLPQLLPTLKSRGCLPDPSTLLPPSAGGCTNGCMGANSLTCRKDEQRGEWFKLVDCEAYEPDSTSTSLSTS